MALVPSVNTMDERCVILFLKLWRIFASKAIFNPAIAGISRIVTQVLIKDCSPSDSIYWGWLMIHDDILLQDRPNVLMFNVFRLLLFTSKYRRDCVLFFLVDFFFSFIFSKAVIQFHPVYFFRRFGEKNPSHQLLLSSTKT